MKLVITNVVYYVVLSMGLLAALCVMMCDSIKVTSSPSPDAYVTSSPSPDADVTSSPSLDAYVVQTTDETPSIRWSRIILYTATIIVLVMHLSNMDPLSQKNKSKK